MNNTCLQIAIHLIYENKQQTKTVVYTVCINSHAYILTPDIPVAGDGVFKS